MRTERSRSGRGAESSLSLSSELTRLILRLAQHRQPIDAIGSALVEPAGQSSRLGRDPARMIRSYRIAGSRPSLPHSRPKRSRSPSRPGVMPGRARGQSRTNPPVRFARGRESPGRPRWAWHSSEARRRSGFREGEQRQAFAGLDPVRVGWVVTQSQRQWVETSSIPPFLKPQSRTRRRSFPLA